MKNIADLLTEKWNKEDHLILDFILILKKNKYIILKFYIII